MSASVLAMQSEKMHRWHEQCWTEIPFRDVRSHYEVTTLFV